MIREMKVPFGLRIIINWVIEAPIYGILSNLLFIYLFINAYVISGITDCIFLSCFR